MRRAFRARSRSKVLINGMDYTSTTASNGVVRFLLQIPSTAANGMQSIGLQGYTSGYAVTATFEVNNSAPASLMLTPTSGAAGTPVTASASGYQAGETVYVSVAGFGTAATTQASSNGSASVTFGFPSVATSGSVTVTMYGARSGTPNSASFDVTTGSPPGFTLTPTSGPPGTTVTAERKRGRKRVVWRCCQSADYHNDRWRPGRTGHNQ